MLLREKISVYCVNIYLFLFIFTMFNREFIPLGIDLRYILLLLALFLIACSIFKFYKSVNQLFFNKQWNTMMEKLSLYFKDNDWLPLILGLFYITMFISTLMWIKNDFIINKDDFKSSIILNSMNLISISIFLIYKKDIKVSNVKTYICVSAVILFISMLLVWSGYHLTEIMGGDYSGLYSGSENHNFLGYDFRLAGYAQDPNYASFFMVIFGATSLFFIRNKLLKFIILIISILGFLLSASRTVTLGVILGIPFVLVWNILNKQYPRFIKIYNFLFIIAITTIPYIIIKLSKIITIKPDLVSMSNRFIMWDYAVMLFEKSPIIGSGLTSFRSFYESAGGWYVQSHSTIFQLISEQGLVGLILFALIFIIIIKKPGSYKQYLCFVFLIFSLTSELVYLSIFSFIVGLLPILNLDYISLQERNL